MAKRGGRKSTNVPAIPGETGAWGADGLTLRQRLFVQYFVGEAAGSASEAVRLAGYPGNNHGLRSTACVILQTPNVQRALQQEIAKKFGSPEDVKAGIASIANANAVDFLSKSEDGKWRMDLDKMAEAGSMGLIHSVKQGRDGIVAIRLHDRLKALELMAKMNGQLKDTIQHTGEVKASISVTADFDHDAYRQSFEQYIAGRMAGTRDPASEANGN